MMCSQKEILRGLALMLTHDNQEMDQDGKDFKRVTFKVRKVYLCIRLSELNWSEQINHFRIIFGADLTRGSGSRMEGSRDSRGERACC